MPAAIILAADEALETVEESAPLAPTPASAEFDDVQADTPAAVPSASEEDRPTSEPFFSSFADRFSPAPAPADDEEEIVATSEQLVDAPAVVAPAVDQPVADQPETSKPAPPTPVAQTSDEIRDQASSAPSGFGGVIQTERPGQTAPVAQDGEPARPDNSPRPSEVDSDRLPASSGNGQFILNIIPTEPGFNREMARTLPVGSPLIALEFVGECPEPICSDTSSPERKSFDDQLKQDIASALSTTGETKITPEEVAVLSVAEIQGRKVVQLALVPNDASVDVTAIVADLEQQVKDRSSPLYERGLVTKDLDSRTFGVDFGMQGSDILSLCKLILQFIHNYSLAGAQRLPFGPTRHCGHRWHLARRMVRDYAHVSWCTPRLRASR